MIMMEKKEFPKYLVVKYELTFVQIYNKSQNTISTPKNRINIICKVKFKITENICDT